MENFFNAIVDVGAYSKTLYVDGVKVENAIAGISGNAVLIAAVKEMILISKAMDAAIAETKQIFSGEKVPFYNQGIFSGIEFCAFYSYESRKF